MTAATTRAKAIPAPRADQDSAFFWEGLKEHRLLVQSCTDCGRRRFPPMPSCPYCASRGFEICESSGVGTVYSWIVVHMALDSDFADEVPYTLATIDLDDGGRVVARLEAQASPVRPGLKVQASFFDHEAWTEIRFEVLQ